MNNLFSNPSYVPFGSNVGSMYQPQQAPVPKNTQPLTKEEMDKLRKQVERFSTVLTEEDILKSRCTHRANGDTALLQNADGSYICSICGERIILDEYSESEVYEITEKFVNLLNVIKVEFMDIPIDVASEFFQIVPYVKRVPQLYSVAHENYSRYVGHNNIGMQNVNANPNYSVWNQFDSLYGGAYAQPMQPNPNMYGAAPQMQPQPMMQPAYGQQPQYAQPMGYTPTQMQQQQMVGGNPMYTAPVQQQPQATQPQQAQPANTQQNADPQASTQATTSTQVQL